MELDKHRVLNIVAGLGPNHLHRILEAFSILMYVVVHVLYHPGFSIESA